METRYARAELERLGVEMRAGAQVHQVDADGVVVGGERVERANVFWCAGLAATPAAGCIGAPVGKHGGIEVGRDCSAPGRPEVFAIGDVASFSAPGGGTLPGVAPVAQQQGAHVAKVNAARTSGQGAPKPLRYRDRGSLAIIGGSAAVASLPHLKLSGRLAWLLWASVHLFLPNGLQNRLVVYLQWMFAWLFHTRGARLMTAGAPVVISRAPR